MPAGALSVPANCQVDPGGANDRPGQRDVTRFCVDTAGSFPWEFTINVNIDEIRVKGTNTIDACALFNTNGDAFANLAVCATLESSGSENDNRTRFREVRLFTCNDTSADKCMGSVQVPAPYNTFCEAEHRDNDPFGPDTLGALGDDYPYDTAILCGVDLDDLGSVSTRARLMDTCSYPSTIPNSDPDDCILYATCRDASDYNDGNACSTDTCDPSGVCVHEPAPGPSCDDVLFCTGPDA